MNKNSPILSGIPLRKIGAFLCAAALSTAVLTGCGGDKDDKTQSGSGTSAGSDGADDKQAPDKKGNNDSEEPVELDHSATLAAGLSGETAIKCVYTYDATELQQLKMLSTSGKVSPGATIYLKDTTVYWDIPEGDNRVAHILGHGGKVYAWKVPGDGKGVVGEEGPDGGIDVLGQRLKKNASNCETYTGPPSVFKVPEDIAFESPAGITKG